MSVSSDRRRGLRRVVVLLMASVLTLGGLIGSSSATSAQVDGTTYIDPTYGYSLSWDDGVWSVSDDARGDLALESDLVQVFFQSGQFYDGDAVACRDDLVQRLPNDPTVETVEPFTDGDSLESDETTRAWSTLAVGLSGSDDEDEREVVERIECRTLVPGEAVLAITWLGSLDAASEVLEGAESLLDDLVTPSAGNASGDGLEVDRFEDPDGGFLIEWDPDAWSAFAPVDATFGLDSSVSLITFDQPGDFQSNAEECLTSSVETFLDSPGLDEARALERDDQTDEDQDGTRWVSAAFEADYGASQRFVEIRCAALPAQDRVLRAVHSGPLDAWEAEAELAAPVFASLATGEAESPAGTPESADDPAGTPGPEGTREPTPDLELDEPITFEAASGEWQVTYDAAVYQPLDSGLYQTVDLALSGSGLVVTFSSIDTGDDPEVILEDLVAVEIGDTDEVTVIDQIPTGTSDGLVGVAYVTGDQDGTATARAFVVIPVGGETLVIVRVFGTTAAFENAQTDLETLIGGFSALEE